jgi:hypothetical protein
VTTTKIGLGILKVISLFTMFSDVRTILEEADHHDLRAHGLPQEMDLTDFVDLEKDVIVDIKKGEYFVFFQVG